MPADYRNDKLHPTLGRARPLQQSAFDADAGGFMDNVGRDSYGTTSILESSGAGGLTDFTMGGHVAGEAWSVNPYSGCLHACSYCYVPDTTHAERVRWGSYVIVKRDLPTRLALAMAKSHKHTVYLSTATDPYQPAEAEHQITRRCLEVLARKDWPVEVLTRSPLVTRDLDLFTQFSQVRVGMSVPTMDDALRRVLEPNAPPIAARLAALRKISNEGVPTFANYTPACPATTHDADAIANKFLDAGIHWANTTRWKRRATTLGPLWERLRGTEWEEMTRFFASRPRQREWKKELGAAFRKLGLPLGGSFYNAPFEWIVTKLPQTSTQAELATPFGRPLPVVQPAPAPRPHPATPSIYVGRDTETMLAVARRREP